MKVISRSVLFIIAGAVCVRLLLLGLAIGQGGEGVLISGDAQTYTEIARNLAAGNGYVVEKDGALVPEIFRAPGTSFLLAPFMLLPHAALWWGVALSIIAGVLLPFFTYRIGKHIGSEEAGIIAAALVAFEPHLVWFSWLPMSDMPATLFFLGALALATQHWKGREWLQVVCIGLLLGAAVLVRPPFLPISFAVLAGVVFWFAVKGRFKCCVYTLIVVAVLFSVTVPWSTRNYVVTGTYAVSGMGWYNVYFDYLSSIDALKNKTSFIQEKLYRLDHPPAGVMRGETFNPASAPALKDAALEELKEKWRAVLLYEPAFLFSYFTHDGYYQYARSFGFVGKPGEPSGSSTTFALLSQKEGRVGLIIKALKEQYFVPLIGRGFAAMIVVLALLGLWYKRREPLVYMFALIVALSAIVATTIGLGVEARSRVPMEPLLFLLAGMGISGLLSRYRGKTESSSYNSGA